MYHEPIQKYVLYHFFMDIEGGSVAERSQALVYVTSLFGSVCSNPESHRCQYFLSAYVTHFAHFCINFQNSLIMLFIGKTVIVFSVSYYFHCSYHTVAWPSGLRHWLKSPVFSEAWGWFPPLPI